MSAAAPSRDRTIPSQRAYEQFVNHIVRTEVARVVDLLHRTPMARTSRDLCHSLKLRVKPAQLGQALGLHEEIITLRRPRKSARRRFAHEQWRILLQSEYPDHLIESRNAARARKVDA